MVALLPEQNAICGATVPARASRLLVILLDRWRQRQVNDRSNGGFIDAKPERDRPHQHAHFIGHPALLILTAHR